MTWTMAICIGAIGSTSIFPNGMLVVARNLRYDRLCDFDDQHGYQISKVGAHLDDRKRETRLGDMFVVLD